MGTKKFIIFFCWLACAMGHEFYSSTDLMANLITKEEELVQSFGDYIEAVEVHLLKLRSVLLVLQILKLSGRPDLEMSDPLAAYKLMRRLREEWATIAEYTKLSPFQEYQDLLEYELQQIPGKNDLDEAAVGIIRLQEIYKLYPQNITTDHLTGTTVHLNLDQTYHLGKVAYTLGSYQHAFLWFLQCLSKIKEHKDADILKQLLFEYLGSSAYLFGNLPYEIYFTQQRVNLDPTNLEARLDLVSLKGQRSAHISNPDILTLNETSKSTYEALCRGEAVKMKSRRKRQLTCRYSTVGGNPKLMYAPVKEEEEWDKPPFMRYHDVISETEIEHLKNCSRPRLQRSEVNSKDSPVSFNRVSQSAGLTEEDPVVFRVIQRLSDITGMDMESADSLEVSNYGIGGHFGPHYDTGKRDESSDGYRIATILIYLSDVGVGGATVFPNIGASLKPQKGTAVMWYNLLQNGQVDEQSLHAGCPVFRGSKWSWRTPVEGSWTSPPCRTFPVP
ncbi:prolyl 4-hydroxylase subunit alpha-2 isoform X2 [Colossoma macropomum]|uniref:prolyl 4-hydroxylase subunit alpha-2 isoform X2 n=1 Tax=Colossoma macropomum TaxID=42526 RepID=UPI001864756D|nr:prolyl 4-hydroxylase subunit alpha-2 isoform X2 [Colossoma macropomum]